MDPRLVGLSMAAVSAVVIAVWSVAVALVGTGPAVLVVVAVPLTTTAGLATLAGLHARFRTADPLTDRLAAGIAVFGLGFVDAALLGLVGGLAPPTAMGLAAVVGLALWIGLDRSGGER